MIQFVFCSLTPIAVCDWHLATLKVNAYVCEGLLWLVLQGVFLHARRIGFVYAENYVWCGELSPFITIHHIFGKNLELFKRGSFEASK